MMRGDFLRENTLKYEYYDFAEDYKWWIEMAKAGAVFYIEPQSLLYYRVSDSQVTRRYKDKMRETSIQIKKEIIDFLIVLNSNRFAELSEILTALYKLQAKNLMTDEDVFAFLHTLLAKNQNLLIIEIK